MTRLATTLGGEVRVVVDRWHDAGRVRPGARGRRGDLLRAPIELDGQVVATLEADLPARAGDRGFLPLFNATLAVAGLVSVIGIVARVDLDRGPADAAAA